MSYSVSGTTITLTRGDTFKAVVSITQQDGSPYVPTSGDKVSFIDCFCAWHKLHFLSNISGFPIRIVTCFEIWNFSDYNIST